MPIDLYIADLKTIPGSKLYQAVSDLTRVDRPLDDRSREGYLLEFKQDVNDKILHSVAAFANTFGGLLIIGVSEDDGRPIANVGVANRGELKTRVASMIASNLFPCPPFDIAECQLASDSQKKLCVVRVRETQEVCLLAKKGEEHPVYVRVEDQTLPANAAQVRALLNRKRQDVNLLSDFYTRIDSFETSLLVFDHRGKGRDQVKSDTYFRVVMCPFDCPPIPLDSALERDFSLLIPRQNPGLEQLSQMTSANIDFFSARDWYELRFVDQAVEYERRWRFTSRGDIGFVTQTRWPIAQVGDYWSLYDVAVDVVRTGMLAREFWRHIRYYGRFRLQADLRVGNLGFDVKRGAYSPLFYERLSNTGGACLDDEAIIIRNNASYLEKAELDLDYPALTESLPNTVATIVNQLLRCLGHSSDLGRLRQTIRLLEFK
ncbi:MAG TPA: ATP-binding protein [Candidatus Acidoferrum sp.]|nr:ATP-binding protein [Candidatus Acidoferrum sp.]